MAQRTEKPNDTERRDLSEVVRARYANAARRAAAGDRSSCCDDSCTDMSMPCCTTASPNEGDPISANLYGAGETENLPAAAMRASLGCGNPTALAQLEAGDIVLDLGSGGGIDVLLSARRVGPTGKAYGLDMTAEMLELARNNARDAGVGNVEFLEGQIESIPLPDRAVDVIISNCVINLSGDKQRVFGEAYRVLKPGGRFAVSDVVVRGEMPPEARKSMELWVGCVAGALNEDEYRRMLGEAGFADIEVEATRVYDVEDAREFLSSAGLDVDRLSPAIQGKVCSAFIRARKPRAPQRQPRPL